MEGRAGSEEHRLAAGTEVEQAEQAEQVEQAEQAAQSAP